MCFLCDLLYHFLNVFVCAEPSKRKGRNSKKPDKTCIFSYFFRMRGFRIFIKILTSKVRFSSQRRRPFGHRFFFYSSSILAPFSHDFSMFFRRCFRCVLLRRFRIDFSSILAPFWRHIGIKMRSEIDQKIKLEPRVLTE